MTQLAAAPIRPATRNDLADIERLLTDSDLPVAGVAEIMRAHPDHFFVAETTGDSPEIVGVAGLEVCCDDALLRSVAVHPEWRKHGVGRELVKRLVCEAEAQGIRALYLLTMTAEHYFPRFGFERIARDSVPAAIAETLEFKSACPASAVAMSRQLAAAS
jgi:amino-acid N-acetyltransferase